MAGLHYIFDVQSVWKVETGVTFTGLESGNRGYSTCLQIGTRGYSTCLSEPGVTLHVWKVGRLHSVPSVLGFVNARSSSCSSIAGSEIFVLSGIVLICERHSFLGFMVSGFWVSCALVDVYSS